MHNEISLKQSKGKELFEQFGGIFVAFRDLPPCAKSAIQVYNIEEHDNVVAPDTLCAYVEVPTSVLKKTVIKYSDDLDDWDNWNKYHEWYMSIGDVPNHENVWAIIIDLLRDEVILDGWHRFHRYAENGVQIVPMVSVCNFES